MTRTPELAATAWELAQDLRVGRLSALAVTEAYLARVAATQELCAYLHVCDASARETAARVDGGEVTGPLAGVPVALKDNLVTRGIPTSCGSKMLEGWIPPYQGGQAGRLERAGTVLLGKLAMDEFAMGSSGENSPYPVVRNPWSPDHVAGGSSGGSAAAVAGRTCAFALGSDTGGSIRQPASFTNVVGLKPTYGRITRHGMVAFASSFDQVGTLTRDVRDAALVLGVLAGEDPRDATSLRAPVPDYVAACQGIQAGHMKGVRVGVHRASLELDGLDVDVLDAFEASLTVLAEAGASIVDVNLPHFSHALATYYVLTAAEASSNLARYDGVRYGLHVAGSDLLETYCNTRERGFGDEVKRRILLGTFVLRSESYVTFYGRAMRVRALIAQDYARAFERCDLLASPVSPVAGFRLGARDRDPLSMYLSDVFTVGANLAGLPAISIPGGFSLQTADTPSLPIGFQLTAPHLQEERLLAVASAHEAMTGHHLRRPPASTPAEAP